MAPPRKHETDTILDAVRARILSAGPRAVSVAIIARDSGAPVGTLYQRFGSRDAIVAETWMRALNRFQQRALVAQAGRTDPVAAAVSMARAVIEFAADEPLDAQLLLAVRRRDLLDAAPDTGLRARIDVMNAPLVRAMRHLARQLHGHADKRTVDAVARAVVDLPGGAVRRHAGQVPGWLAEDVADDVRALLTGQLPQLHKPADEEDKVSRDP